MIPIAIIMAALKTTESIFVFLCTEQGQKQVEEWRNDRVKFKADWQAAGEWFKKLSVGWKIDAD